MHKLFISYNFSLLPVNTLKCMEKTCFSLDLPNALAIARKGILSIGVLLRTGP
jgi:hypothetical protein